MQALLLSVGLLIMSHFQTMYSWISVRDICVIVSDVAPLDLKGCTPTCTKILIFVIHDLT